MPVAVRQITSDINVATSSAEYRRVLSGAGAPRLEGALESLGSALDAPQGSSRLDVLTRAWHWRTTNRPDDALLRTLIFSSAAAAGSGIKPTAVALELRVGTSILDCAILNPQAEEAVEIKSGLDSMSRLPDQIRNYHAGFPRVTLLGDERSHAKLARFAIANHAGLVIARRDGPRWRLENVHSPTADWESVQLRIVLGMLRTREILDVARSFAGKAFAPTPVNVFGDSVAALSPYSIAEVASRAYAAIRARRNISNRSLSRDIPLPIRATIAEINPHPEQLSELRDWLSTEV